MKKIHSSIVGSVFLSAFISLPLAAALPESTDPIKVVDNNWSSQKVLARVASQLLTKVGYKTEVVPADTQGQFAAMGTGDLHLQMEVWEGSMHKSFMKEVEAGRMADGGSHTATTREEWWYPDYVEEICPGLPDYKALNDCAPSWQVLKRLPRHAIWQAPLIGILKMSSVLKRWV